MKIEETHVEQVTLSVDDVRLAIEFYLREKGAWRKDDPTRFQLLDSSTGFVGAIITWDMSSG